MIRGDGHGHSDIGALLSFVERYKCLFVLTGAGCSTAAGIPDYRDAQGAWKRGAPVQHRDFVHTEGVRRRYWARSMVGWPRFATAAPTRAHRALARLEESGFVHQLVTQNVDGLHQCAGSRRVLDLHGRLDKVECLGCGHALARAELQQSLSDLNPEFASLPGGLAPDGDAELEAIDLSGFRVPSCARCGGTLKPAVVFFGAAVPRARVDFALTRLAQADAVLVVGSSLMVYSGYRFCRAAWEQGKPVAAINLGRTRADAELSLKLHADCGEMLTALIEDLLHRLPMGVGNQPTIGR